MPRIRHAAALPFVHNETVRDRLRTAKWAMVRLFIQAYVIFCLFSVFGGLAAYPITSYIFLGQIRFWRYLRLAPPMYFFLVRSAWLMVKGGTTGFMFSVPLTDPPTTTPFRDQTRLRGDWPHGDSCGDCTGCCDRLGCPIVTPDGKGCLGYDSIYWRYFNCGRFPTSRKQLDYYQCRKWEIK